jgi:hypothetical protein
MVLSTFGLTANEKCIILDVIGDQNKMDTFVVPIECEKLIVEDHKISRDEFSNLT